MQKVIRLVLANEGFDIQTAKNGVEALEALKTHTPDICILDAGLKELGAFEVKAKAAEIPGLQNVQFILLTSAYEKIEETRIRGAGFQGHLVKPFDPSELREVIAEVRSQLPLSAKPTPAPPPMRSKPAVPNIPPPRGMPTPPAALPPSSLPPVHFEPPADEPVSPTPEGDIRDLTESTIRMSGLDDYQWNIQDPSLPPPPKSADLGGMTFSLDEELDSPQNFSNLSENVENAENTDTIELANFEPPEFQAPDFHAMPSSTESENTTEVNPFSTHVPNADQIERLVRAQVEEILRKMAERTLPDLAEKIVREEFKRLMDETL